MAVTTNRSSLSEPAAITPTFSYAQAAKGLSSSGTSSAQASAPPSGGLGPKDTKTSTQNVAETPSVMSWADEAEAHNAKESRDAPTSAGNNAEVKTTEATVRTPSNPPSPDFGLDMSTASTLVKEEDAQSAPPPSSESTWDTKSQVSSTGEKATDSTEEEARKIKAKRAEGMAAASWRALQEAPIPTVNIWKQRAEQAKAKAVSQTSSSKAAPAVGANIGDTMNPAGDRAGHPTESGSSRPNKSNVKDSQHPVAATGAQRNKRPVAESSDARKDEEKSAGVQRSGRNPAGADKPKRSVGKAAEEGSAKQDTPLPPSKDKQSWPTPNLAQDEDRKKTQEKVEKPEKDTAVASGPKQHGKNEWKHMDFTPSVVFNTPLPNTGARRGGRGGARGGRENGGRGGLNGSSSGDKSGSMPPPPLPNGEPGRRGRTETSAGRDVSPSVDRRAASAGAANFRDPQAATTSREPSQKRTGAPRTTSTHGKRMSITDALAPRQGPNSGSTTFPRTKAADRTKQSLASDAVGPTEHQGQTDHVPPNADSSVPGHDRRRSTAIQADGKPRKYNGRRQSIAAPDSSAFPSADAGERNAGFADENGPFRRRSGSNERRGGSYGFRNRGDRGRGGARGGRGNGYHNPQSLSTSTYANGHSPRGSVQSSNAYPLPRSPTSYQHDAMSYYGIQASSRGYRAAGPRSQSTTGDGLYSRYPPGHPSHQGLPPVQTYLPHMYDYSMMPMSAMPYSPWAEAQIYPMIMSQLEYYFSVDNLCKDIHLRKHMDSQGLVLLTFVAGFNRLKQITHDLDLLKRVCLESSVIELFAGPDGKDRLRRARGWEQWVMAMEERDESAQNEGPPQLFKPPMPPMPPPPSYGMPPPYQHPATAGPLSPGALPSDAFFPATNGASPTSAVNGAPGVQEGATSATSPEIQHEAPNGINSTLAALVPAGNVPEPDSFTSDHIEGLKVVVNSKESASEQSSIPKPAHSTLSNGSINGDGATEAPKTESTQDTQEVNGHKPRKSIENLALFDRLTLSRQNSDSQHDKESSPVFWVKDDTPRPRNSIDESASNTEPYTVLRFNALSQRAAAEFGQCPNDLAILYQFWTHFLIRNFNTDMYNEFRQLAFEDVSQRGSDVGMRHLREFYGAALMNDVPIRERLARHYVDLVAYESSQEERPAFKQLRAQWRNGALNLKNRAKITPFVNANAGLQSDLEQ